MSQRSFTPQEILGELVNRDRAEKSLYEFVKYGWKSINPENDFVDTWHVGALCEHTQAVLDGQIRNLLVNVPPRSLKSRLVGIAAPAWQWTHRPNESFILASYAYTLARDSSVRVRQLLRDRWFQARWGGKFNILEGQDRSDQFANDKGGEFIISSPDSVLTGRGADIFICFPYETMIRTEIGDEPIGAIVEGRLKRKVASFNHDSGETEPQDIIGWEENQTEELIEIELDDRVIRCTDRHPIMVVGRGYIEAKDVAPGDQVTLLS